MSVALGGLLMRNSKRRVKMVRVSPELVRDLDSFQRAVNESLGIRINRVKASELYPKVKGYRGKSLFERIKELLS